MAYLLEVEELSVSFRTEGGEITPVDGIRIAINPGDTMCIVGESGSGKSAAALAILRLLGEGGRISGGSVRLNGEDLVSKTEAELRSFRGKEIAMIFQEPMTALNPVLSVGSQLIEAIRLHSKRSRKEARRVAAELLRSVGIPRPEAVLGEYPHSLSGGMRQRVVIAMALAGDPKLLIADEPTTALDVTIQAQILELMKRFRERSGAAIVLITHDLGVVAEMADRVAVMYAGRIVEEADVFSLFENPLHPYTQGLMRSVPSPDAVRGQRLVPIPGSVPSPAAMPAGCRFHERCPQADRRCREEEPPLEPVRAGGHKARCWAVRELLPAPAATVATVGGGL